MMCRKVSVFVVLLGYTSASILELNETTLRSFPPLYALDEWTDCQAAGDVYCMVDAALVSKEPSPLLSLLQEYSAQTLKHYNRSQIHRGVCVSRCGAMEHGTWHAAARHCLNESVHKYGLQVEIESVAWCSSKDMPYSAREWSARALAVVCTLLVALACLATALHALGTRLARTDGNKYLLAFSMKQNWDILTYDRAKPRSDERMKDVACLEGIRVIGMQCVIFSHVMLIHVYSYIDNPEFVEKMYDQFGWKGVLNSPLWVQAFFSISGFLTAYVVLISSDSSPITPWKCLVSIISRWVRLTPVAVFALWFTIAWFPALGSGPQWAWVVTREAEECSERWWYHLLYVHNHLPTGKFCMGHTWYLAVDMQLHVFGLFLLLAARHWRRGVPLLLAAPAAASALAAGLLLHRHRLQPIATAQAPEVLRTMFAGSQTLTLLYLPMWMNLPGYVAGLASAFIYRHIQLEGIKLNQIKWFNILFHLSLPLGGCVVFSGAAFLSDRAPAAWAGALYAALDRTLLAVCFNVFMLGCMSRCRSGMSSLVSWRGWQPVGRLSYCVFVLHFIVLRLTAAAHAHLAHATILTMVSMLITSSVLSYIAAIPVCLLVELPALQLWRAVTGESRPAPAPAPTPAPAPAPAPQIKPLDLLANVVRRNDV